MSGTPKLLARLRSGSLAGTESVVLMYHKTGFQNYKASENSEPALIVADRRNYITGYWISTSTA